MLAWSRDVREFEEESIEPAFAAELPGLPHC